MTDFLTRLKALSSRQGQRGSAGKPSKASGSNAQTNGSQASPLVALYNKVKDGSEKLKLPSQPTNGASPSPGKPFFSHPLYRKWWAWTLLGVGFGAAGATVAVIQTIATLEKELPNTKDALAYVRSGSLTIKAEDGTVLQQTGPATRDKVALPKMPPNLMRAFISSEDQDFYKHGGVNYMAIVRASLKNLTSGQVVEGGSTITQQLARIVFLTQERSIMRKVREALLAQKMEAELSKNQILEQYLNLVYLGSGAYGVADAAWVYFSKNVDQLTLGEMAMIAGMAPAPSVYSPLVNPELARQRRNIVLERMVHAGYITEAERSTASAEPIALKPGATKNLYSQVPYFTSYIQQELPKYVSPEELEMGGLTVETTLNLKWQKQAQAAVKKAIEEYGPGDAFKQAALVSIEPRTGEVKALVGGDDFQKSQFNRATQALRQPGSTFKAFVYTTAIAAGFSPYRSYMDAKYTVDGYEPHNYGKNYRGSVSMYDALVSSINIVAVKTLVDVGWDPIIEVAQKMGIKSKLLPTYSLALGTSEVNLLELTSAYGTLANQGNHVEPHGIVRVLNRFGKVIYQAKFQPKRVIDADTASIMTWMLEGVVNSGTGRNAYLSDRQVAGKTGTSEKRRDLWFVGYIPQLVTGVWMGNDDSSPTWGASSTAALTWYDFMREATDDIPVEDFPKIPNLDSREGTIKAKPLKPARIYAATAPTRDSDEEDGEGGSSWGSSDEAYDSGSSYGGSSYGGSSYSEDSGSSSGSYSEPAAESSGSSYAAPSDSAPPPASPEAPPEASAPPAEAAPPASEPPPSEPASPAPPAPIDQPPPAPINSAPGPAAPAPPAFDAPLPAKP